jgi:hypothetical protein
MGTAAAARNQRKMGERKRIVKTLNLKWKIRNEGKEAVSGYCGGD